MISIIIPAYKEENYLAKTLDSIKDSTFKDYEIIVVVNGIKDPTFDIAKRYTESVFFIKDANVSKARNFGAKKAQGDVIVFLDADTRFSRNALKEISDHKGCITTLKMRYHPNKAIYAVPRMIKNMLISSKLYTTSNGVIALPKDVADNLHFDENKRLGEDTEYIRSAVNYVPFKMITGSYAITSARRYEGWGMIGSAIFWLLYRDKEKKYTPIR